MLQTRMPSRTVHQGDGVAWLRAHEFTREEAIVTSMPDASELPALGFEGWRAWFIETARLICSSVHPEAPVIFFQTDVKREGRWIDKGHLVHLGADAANAHLLWNKVVCRAPAGTTTFGRPAYAHLLCFSSSLLLETAQSTPDVLPKLGDMPWPRAMGVAACEATAQFLLKYTSCRTVIDPFCGIGTMLAVANNHGLDAIGVELSPKRAARARTLELRQS